MIRVIPGSGKDVKTLLPSMDEIKLTNAILILDTGFVSDEVLEGIFDRNCSAVVHLSDETVTGIIPGFITLIGLFTTNV